MGTVWVFGLLWLSLGGRTIGAEGWETAQQQFYAGQYQQCIEGVRAAIKEGIDSYHWPVLLLKSLLATGQYDQAYKEASSFVNDTFPLSMPLLMVAHEAYQDTNHGSQAHMLLERIYRMAAVRRIDYLDAQELVAVGRAVLLLGGEPRIILEEFYSRAQRKDPNDVTAFIAAGELALDKQDYELAAQQYQTALKRFADVPAVHVGLAQAFYPSDRQAMLQALNAALVINPQQCDALLLLAEHEIDAENYAHAQDLLDQVLHVNPWRPEAWSLKAVLAVFTSVSQSGQYRPWRPEAWSLKAVLATLGYGREDASVCRKKALTHWPTNPAVDSLIGRKLAQKYRFSEAADFQRKALNLASDYLPAQIELAQDLLRLGQDNGWDLAAGVYKADQYNIMAYNLTNLRDVMAGYQTLTTENLVVHMPPLAADIYGQRVVQLLQEARNQLGDKYGVDLDHRVTLELFADQQDFAVRTFGMPGGDGYLGVCFGDVITANCPKLERLSNWQATLWHEFCHVVTLNLTHNKMPRWLSEGISVYEESQRQPTWGQHMNPQYRHMILNGELTPVGQLSSAFLSPASAVHLQFAYYESSLVVEFIVDHFGLGALRSILVDLGDGVLINDALTRHTTDLDQLEKDFATFARQRAESLAPGMDWTQPETGQVDSGDLQAVQAWNDKHPDNFWGLTQLAQLRIAQQQWDQAVVPLKRLVELYPEHVEADSAYALLASVYRQQNDTAQETAILQQWAQRSADAAPAYQRLTEIYSKEQQWKQVLTNADRYLGVYPMLGSIYEQMGRAQEALGHPQEAIGCYQCDLKLDPADPVDVHYRLAQLYRQQDPALAKRHLLEALADAPRFRAGLQLLLQMQDSTTPTEMTP